MAPTRKRKLARVSPVSAVDNAHVQGQDDRISEAFDTYANDDVGRISVKRTKVALRHFFDMEIGNEEIQQVSNVMNDSDSLTWSAFSKFVASKLRQHAKSSAAFVLFDRDGKGLICLEDVNRVATELGEAWTEEELEEMMHEADPSGEGLIDEKAFFRIVRKLNL